MHASRCRKYYHYYYFVADNFCNEMNSSNSQMVLKFFLTVHLLYIRWKYEFTEIAHLLKQNAKDNSDTLFKYQQRQRIHIYSIYNLSHESWETIEKHQKMSHKVSKTALEVSKTAHVRKFLKLLSSLWSYCLIKGTILKSRCSSSISFIIFRSDQ